jgi:hypothetical protein
MADPINTFLRSWSYCADKLQEDNEDQDLRKKGERTTARENNECGSKCRYQ